MTDLIYEASVYQRTVKYTNFKGDTKESTLYFALDPLELLAVIAGYEPKLSKSNNPALRGKPEDMSSEQQVTFIRDLAKRAAGFPSDDGESFDPYPEFSNKLDGKAFLTKLASSDGDRREFAEKVILNPFRSFISYAVEDPSNSEQDVKQFKTMLEQMENIFTGKADPNESLDDRRARLNAELAALSEGNTEGS